MTVDFRIPELETERLRLRLPQASDLEAHRAFRMSERSRGVGGPFPSAEAFTSLSAIIGQWQLRGYGRWMVTDKGTGTPLGVVGIFHPDDWPEAEIGWSVYDAAEGKGIAHEAALAARDYAYTTLGWNRIVSMISEGNLRSETLARRMGCRNERVFAHPTYGQMNIWVHPAPEAL